MRCLSRPFDGLALRRSDRLRLSIGDQSHHIRFKPLTVFGRMAQQEFDQPALARTKMPGHPAPRKAMQDGNWLLGKQPLELVSRHERSQSSSWKFFQYATAQSGDRLGCAVRQRWVRVP